MEKNYAILPDRIKAAFIDSIVLIAAMYGAAEILNLFDNVPNSVKIIIALVLFVLYDPFFTSYFGGTIGHSYSNIYVAKDSDSTKKISFPRAILRYILKVSLGWLSLLTVTGSKEKKAIHDLAASSVVLSENK